MPPPRLFAATAPGLEAAAAAELRALGFAAVSPVHGGVDCVGDPLRANRWAAIPNRILQRVARYPAHTFEALVAGAARVDWTPFGGLTPTVSCRKSRLYHSTAVAERLAAVVPPGPGQLFVRLSRDRCTLSVDTSGALLHRRGWRLETGPAPLRETLAAGILRLAGWAPGEPLLDPMCGSGTFAIEAAIAASGRPPGGQRRFACEAWVTPAAPSAAQPAPTPVEDAPRAGIIWASDRATAAVDAARRNAERAGVDIALTVADAATRGPPAPTGLLVCNPPYGRRVRGHRPYRLLGRLLTGPFAEWRAAIICARPEQIAALARPVRSRARLKNGGLNVELVVL